MASFQLRLNNPYAKGAVYTFPSGHQFLRRRLIDYTESPHDALHLVRTEDTLSDLAYKYYGDSKYWWVLADTNQIHNPFDLEAGKHLLIPDFDKLQAFYL